MTTLKPIVLAVLGCGLVAGCAPTSQPLSMQPLVRADQPASQPAAWNRLGRFHHERGQLALALGAYAQSLSLDARQMEARNAVAVIEAQQGHLENARQALVALVNDFPSEAQPHTNLGYVYYLMGKQDDAVQTLRRAMALGAGPKAYQNLQLAEAAQHKPDGTAPAAMLAAAPLPAIAPAAAPVQAQAAAAPAAPAAVAVAVAPVATAPAPAPAVASMPAAAPASVAAAPAATPVAAPAATLAAAAPSAPAKPALAAAPALPAPQAAEPAPRAPMPNLQVVPDARQVASRMELVQLTPNVYELKQRPSMAPVAALAVPVKAPAAPAAEPAKPAVAAVAKADKVDMARLEVANGNGVTGMARRFRSLLGQLGIPVNRLSNDKPYRQVATTIQYSPGYEKQAASLQKALQGKAQLASRQLQSSDVRLVLGKDAPQALAAATEASGLTLVAAQDDQD